MAEAEEHSFVLRISERRHRTIKLLPNPELDLINHLDLVMGQLPLEIFAVQDSKHLLKSRRFRGRLGVLDGLSQGHHIVPAETVTKVGLFFSNHLVCSLRFGATA